MFKNAALPGMPLQRACYSVTHSVLTCLFLPLLPAAAVPSYYMYVAIDWSFHIHNVRAKHL